MKPLVSVVIPVYNRGARVQATIDSVLAQTVAPESYELIVVDDGSTDDTAEFIEHTYGDDKRVWLIRQQNSGVAAARNKGLAAAHGEFIAFLDHDDRWLPEKLEAQLKAFEATPRAAVVYCLWEDVDEQGKVLPPEHQLLQLDNWQPETGFVYSALVPHNFIVSMSVPLIRTAALRAVGGFDPDTVPCDDWDVWLRLARQHQFECVPQRLVLYTRHSLQQSNQILHMNQGEQRTLIKQWPYHLTQPRKLWLLLCRASFLKSAPLYYAAKEELAQGTRAHALSLLSWAVLQHPLALLSPQWLYLLKRLVTNNRNPY